MKFSIYNFLLCGFVFSLMLIVLFPTKSYSVQKCEFKIGCPEEFNNDTIVVPTKVYFLSSQITLCTGESVSKSQPPSIVFVIDNSGSMLVGTGSRGSATDPLGFRFTVTSSMIDSIYKFAPNAEVSLVVFSSTLELDPGAPQYFSRYFKSYSYPALRNKNPGYLMPMKLDSLYDGKLGKDIIKEVLLTESFSDEYSDTYVNLVTKPVTYQSGYGTNINLGFSAARDALAETKTEKKNQFVVFLSDGEPSVDGDPNSDDFISGAGMPTTFTVYFTDSKQAPDTIKQMTNNIKKNGYSSSNALSNLWASKSSNLMSLLTNNVLATIRTVTQAVPSTLTVNSIAPVSVSDSTYSFNDRFALNIIETPFRFAIAYRVTDQGTGVSHDSTSFINFVVKRSDQLPPDPRVTISCWEEVSEVVTVTAPVNSISENEGAGIFTISRNENVNTTIAYYQISGTALSGIDYISVADSVVFQNGQQSIDVMINAKSDNLVENAETVVLKIDSVRAGKNINYDVGTPSIATIVIQDDISETVTVTPSVPTISENGGAGNFTISRNKNLNVTTVYFQISGTATPGNDYDAVPDSVVFQNGQQSIDITIKVRRDDLLENRETVILKIDSVKAGKKLQYIVGTPSNGTIAIADYMPTIRVSTATPTISENNGAGVFKISRSDPVGDCAIYYTVSGSALQDLDYIRISDSLVLKNGQESADITITALRDSLTEIDESVILKIDSLKTGRVLRYLVGSPSSATITIANYTTLVTIRALDSVITESSKAGRFLVTRSDSAGQSIVHYSVNGSAENGLDYTTISDSIVLQNGVDTATITISPLVDNSKEQTETVLLTIKTSGNTNALKYKPGSPDNAIMRITDFTPTTSFVPRIIHNPFIPNKSPVPDNILEIPGINRNDLTIINGKAQGMILVVEESPRLKIDPPPSGTVSIFDVMLNVVIKDKPLTLEENSQRLYFLWNGRNRDNREVGIGTYLAVFTINENPTQKTILKRRIGVKK